MYKKKMLHIDGAGSSSARAFAELSFMQRQFRFRRGIALSEGLSTSPSMLDSTLNRYAFDRLVNLTTHLLGSIKYVPIDFERSASLIWTTTAFILNKAFHEACDMRFSPDTNAGVPCITDEVLSLWVSKLETILTADLSRRKARD